MNIRLIVSRISENGGWGNLAERVTWAFVKHGIPLVMNLDSENADDKYSLVPVL